MRAILYAAGAAAFIGIMAVIGNMEEQDRETERQHYCEMLEIWDETDGEYGWPPYDGECE